MRMWMVDPKIMCRQHLLGEHVECHMLAGTLAKGKSILGFLKKGLVEPTSLVRRHQELAEEMWKRGYSHKSPLQIDDSRYSGVTVNQHKSLSDLVIRCPECAQRFIIYGW